MREWQVGDPVGDGNDIGVPDIPYMGYLSDSDDELSVTDTFKFFMNSARFNSGKNDGMAFSYLKSAFEMYERMGGSQKSQLSDEPFNRYWVVDLCCRTLNAHGNESRNAYEIIKRLNLNANVCMDCDCMYPSDYSHCIRCGKELEHYGKTPEKLAEELEGILRQMMYDKSKIAELVSRSLILMKSNGCKIVGIESTGHGYDFIFEKEHKYFKTRYICEYVYDTVRIFEDFGIEHDYENLLADESFKKLIRDTEKRTGFTFMECDGGYGSDLDRNGFDFVFNDEIYVIARFDMGDGRTAVYKIDLDNMRLSDEYDVY